MLSAELIPVAMLGLWAALVCGEMWSGHRLQSALLAHSRSNRADGIAFRTLDGATWAGVLGAFRPTIYVGAHLLDSLDRDELRAVLLHEDYHRRTRAPLRAASIGASARLFGHWKTADSSLADRLAAIECEADTFAIRSGASRSAIARALMKVTAAESGTAFATLAEARTRNLLAASAASSGSVARLGLPSEWLPLVVATALFLGCQVVGA